MAEWKELRRGKAGITDTDAPERDTYEDQPGDGFGDGSGNAPRNAPDDWQERWKARSAPVASTPAEGEDNWFSHLDGPRAASSSSGDAWSAGEDRYGTRDRYGDPIVPESSAWRYTSPDYGQGAETVKAGGVPKKHLAIAVALLCVATAGWVFRHDVRGLAASAKQAISRATSPSSGTPGETRQARIDKTYTLESFLRECATMPLERARAIVEKQPDLLKSAPEGTPVVFTLARSEAKPDILRHLLDKLDPAERYATVEGRTVLHTLIEEEASEARILTLIRSFDTKGVNLTDSKGRTPLHLAAGAKVLPSVPLALRSKGATPVLRDSDGKLPLDYLLATWGGLPREIPSREQGLANTLGFNVPKVFADRNGKRQMNFFSIASLVSDVEIQRYFVLLSEARRNAREGGVSVMSMASGDFLSPPPDSLAQTLQRINRGVGDMDRKPTDPLWKALALAKGTGGAAAKLKALLPEAYPATITYFANLLNGTAPALTLAHEWDGWDVPPGAQIYLLMEMINQRVKERNPNAAQRPVPSYRAQSQAQTRQRVVESIRQRGDSPGTRNPVLMIWLLLDSARAQNAPAAGSPVFLGVTDERTTPAKQGSDKTEKLTEQTNIIRLRRALPDDVWRAVGRTLAASAYAAGKSRQHFGAALMPDAIKKKGGLQWVRTWGCEDRGDASEPMTRVLAQCPKVSLPVAKAMVALVLRSDLASSGPDKEGVVASKRARALKLHKDIVAMLVKAEAQAAKKAAEKAAREAAKAQQKTGEGTRQTPAPSRSKPSVKPGTGLLNT